MIIWPLSPPSGYATALPLRKDQLDIKNAQWAKKMIGVKFHSTSYRVWAPQAPKWHHKNSTFFNSKVAKFAG